MTALDWFETLWWSGAAFSLVVALAAWLGQLPRASDTIELPAVTAIVPAAGRVEELKSCLDHLAADAPQTLVRVIVVVQAPSAEILEFLAGPSRWGDELMVVQLAERVGKAAAVHRGIEAVETDWVLLVDLDTWLEPKGLETMLSHIVGADAVYGLIAPRDTGGASALDQIVRVEKLLSHGAWRWGRSILGIGPNLPGQCYLARREMLVDLYDPGLGYLDDVALTARALATGKVIGFAPSLVATEHGRSSWGGLLMQRGRYTLGVLRSLVIACSSGRRRAWASWCIGVHAWLYYGICIGAVVTSVVVGAEHGILQGMMLLGAYLALLTVAALVADRNVRRVAPAGATAYRPNWAIFPVLVSILAIFKVLGLFAAVWLLVGPRRAVAYRR